jgi:hypothetical protein
MTGRLVLTALLVSTALAAGQTPEPKKKKDNVPAGYRKLSLEGFTLYYSDRVHEEDRASKLKRTPLEALETELQLVNAVLKNLSAEKLKKIKSVPIWVEWDERVAMGNGRGGGAVAVFLGGHQAGLMARGDDPVKANAVTILSLRSLASEHQPGNESGRCVTLHELAHAFHYHVVGDDNPQVKATYKQAMERKLYDPALYAATNEYEYFAELSCCYLKKLDYFPRTREELKKHDPKGYELMLKVWGRAPESKEPTATAAVGPKLASPDGDGQFSLKATRAEIEPGQTLVGTLPDKAQWAGRPVLAVEFPVRSGRALAAVSRLNALYADLEDFGLIAFGVETDGARPAAVEKIARVRGITFPLVADTDFGNRGGYRLPHAYVFDHAGQCVFRGNPLDAEAYARVAVGRAILARVDADLTDKATKPVADLLNQGAPMPQVFTKLADQMRTAPKDGGAGLKALQTELIAGAQKVLDAAKEKEKTDPVTAYFDAQRLTTAYHGTPIEKPAASLMTHLSGNPKVEREVRARGSLNGIKKLDIQLAGKDLSFDPRLPDFREDNAALLKQLADAVDKLRKTYPGTRAADEAARLAERWDLAVK